MVKLVLREEEEKRRLEQERIRKEKQRSAASIEERCQNQTMQLDILRAESRQAHHKLFLLPSDISRPSAMMVVSGPS